MLQHNLLATGSVLIGLLGSAARAQTLNVQGKASILAINKIEPTVGITGAVVEVIAASSTVYSVYCADMMKDDIDTDPCPIMAGSVTQGPTNWVYNVDKTTTRIKFASNLETSGKFDKSVIAHQTNGQIICGVTSNTAACSGSVTSIHVTNGIDEVSGKELYTTLIRDVSANLVPVTITSGGELLQKSTGTGTGTPAPTPTSTSTTSPSKGAAAAAYVTQPAGGLLLGIAGAAAVVGGAIVL